MTLSHAPGPIALVGAGEYLAVMAPIEGALIAGRGRRYVQLATAAVPDGDAVVAKWHRLGAEQAERLGVEQVIVPVADRTDADNPAFAELIADAGLIYLSGGHPAFLAETLRDTLVLAAMVDAWRSGAALAGCSAGAMVMGSWVPALRSTSGVRGVPGLNLVPSLRVIPHFDSYFAKVAGALHQFLDRPDDDVTVVGIDDNTALIGGPHDWEVAGQGDVTVLHPYRQTFTAGERLHLS